MNFFSGPYFPVFSPNTGKYGQKKLRIWNILAQWVLKRVLSQTLDLYVKNRYMLYCFILSFREKNMKHYSYHSLCEKCPYSELFWSAFSCIRPQRYCISPYSVWMWTNADKNNSECEHFSRSHCYLIFAIHFHLSVIFPDVLCRWNLAEKVCVISRRSP